MRWCMLYKTFRITWLYQFLIIAYLFDFALVFSDGAQRDSMFFQLRYLKKLGSDIYFELF